MYIGSSLGPTLCLLVMVISGGDARRFRGNLTEHSTAVNVDPIQCFQMVGCLFPQPASRPAHDAAFLDERAAPVNAAMASSATKSPAQSRYFGERRRPP
jgi:hypothetical protein